MFYDDNAFKIIMIVCSKKLFYQCLVSNARAQDAENLQNCYVNGLRLADENGIASISFPAISTGAF
ncbi:MAG: macro domain-containing protein [Candidatus Bathyarchaeota archaeon]|nr:MAG: macro domain-containing protein [Candidatus Bathyarchaeota archaeon]